MEESKQYQRQLHMLYAKRMQLEAVLVAYGVPDAHGSITAVIDAALAVGSLSRAAKVNHLHFPGVSPKPSTGLIMGPDAEHNLHSKLNPPHHQLSSSGNNFVHYASDNAHAKDAATASFSSSTAQPHSRLGADTTEESASGRDVDKDKDKDKVGSAMARALARVRMPLPGTRRTTMRPKSAFGTAGDRLRASAVEGQGAHVQAAGPTPDVIWQSSLHPSKRPGHRDSPAGQSLSQGPTPGPGTGPGTAQQLERQPGRPSSALARGDSGSQGYGAGPGLGNLKGQAGRIRPARPASAGPSSVGRPGSAGGERKDRKSVV